MSNERHACVIIGEPGIGKSTLVETLTRAASYEDYSEPFYFRRYDAGPVELGRRREDFSGTDALPMSVQPKVEQWLNDITPRLLLFEGDRLSNAKFFAHLRRLGYVLHLYELSGPAYARERRKMRGSDQDPTWLKGRASKVRNLSEAFSAKQINAKLPPAMLAQILNDPVAGAFR